MKKKVSAHVARSSRRELVLIVVLLVLISGVAAVARTAWPQTVGRAAEGHASLGAPATAVTATVTPDLPPGYPSDYPQEKAWDEYNQAQAAAQARKNAPPKPETPLPTFPPQPAPTLPTGIVNGDSARQGPFSAAEFLVQNKWQGRDGDDWLMVYAGANKDMAAGGAVGRAALRIYILVPTAMGGFDLSLRGIYPAPTISGPLTITSVTGDVLQLRTDGGEELAFNLATQTYQ